MLSNGAGAEAGAGAGASSLRFISATFLNSPSALIQKCLTKRSSQPEDVTFSINIKVIFFAKVVSRGHSYTNRITLATNTYLRCMCDNQLFIMY